MSEGVDYFATQPLSVEQCLRSSGKLFVARYYDDSGGTSPKCLDLAEANSLHSAGLVIDTVYETVPTSYAYFSYNQGVTDAQQAKARAQGAGQPASFPIYFAIDYDASSAELAGQITEYFNGVYATMAGAYPLGVYGSYRVIEHANANWPVAVPFHWQTYAWSGGLVSAFSHIYQYLNDTSLCGIGVDLDQQYDTGAW